MKALAAAGSEEKRNRLALICSEAHAGEITVTDGNDLHSLTTNGRYDVILMWLPFSDRFGADDAVFAAKNSGAEVMILAPSKSYEELCVKLSPTGIMILPGNSPRALILCALRNAICSAERLRELRAERDALYETVNEIKLVNRAKCVLIEYLRISEKEAHRRMQKSAMDRRITLSEAAMEILKTYEYR